MCKQLPFNRSALSFYTLLITRFLESLFHREFSLTCGEKFYPCIFCLEPVFLLPLLPEPDRDLSIGRNEVITFIEVLHGKEVKKNLPKNHKGKRQEYRQYLSYRDLLSGISV